MVKEGWESMATMMIVEDESFERNALKTCIDWELIGVQIIGEAANGAQGLNLAMELKPDIILTDVNMPVMNAIQMTERVRKILPETKILFLSSYDNFEYARQGIDLNIFSYITKPVNEAELLRCVKKAVDQITEASLEKKLYNKIKNNYQISLKLARQAMISRVLMGISVDEGEIIQQNLSWLNGNNGFLGEIVSTYDEQKTEELDRNIGKLVQECKKHCSKVEGLNFTRGILITVFCVSSLEDKGKGEELKRIVKDFLEENGCKNIRMETDFDEQGTQSAGQLFDRIRQRSLSFLSMQSNPVSDKKKGKQQIVDEIENIINIQYCSPLTIESIAKTMHFTPNYIGNVFKTIKGYSINRYLTNVRMENAKRLLREQKLAVSDIALKCGYDNITYFHTTFKREMGVTPIEYRQQHLGI